MGNQSTSISYCRETGCMRYEARNGMGVYRGGFCEYHGIHTSSGWISESHFDVKNYVYCPGCRQYVIGKLISELCYSCHHSQMAIKQSGGAGAYSSAR
jgi:hypothetical protein